MTTFPPQHFEDGLGYLAGHLLCAFRQGVARRCEEAGCNVTPEELLVLTVLSRHDGATQGEIARIVAKDRSVVTRLIGRLVERGYVTRRHDARDRRRVRAFLTAEGRQAHDRMLPELRAFVAGAMRGVEAGEFETTCGVLRRVIGNLRDTP